MNKRTSSYTDLLFDRGMAHLLYTVSCPNDIVNPYSIPGYRLLSDDFVEFLDAHRSMIPKKMPIVLEILADGITEKQAKALDETIWTHCALNMANSENAAKKCLKRSFIYLLLTILSSAPIFLSNDMNVSLEIISSFAYLPFWFFAYRLLTFLILDCVPIFSDRAWYRRLASLKLVISGDGVSAFDKLDPAVTGEECLKYGRETDEELRNNKLVREYLYDDDGEISLACMVKDLTDIVPIPELKGREFLSDGIAGYLEQAAPFVKKGMKINLSILGRGFDPDEQRTILQAIDNHFFFRLCDEEHARKQNRVYIYLFLLFVAISCLIITVYGKRVDLVSHEFLMLMFWFFADYALEFILISVRQLNRTKRIWQAFRDMKVTFNEDTDDLLSDED